MATQHILTTKIQVPPLPPQTVRRARLLEELDRGLQPNIRVTLISAPAGYGKTTLLSDWLQGRDLAAAWFSISEGDNDAARFMSYLIAAVRSKGTPGSSSGTAVPPGEVLDSLPGSAARSEGTPAADDAGTYDLEIPTALEGQLSAQDYKERLLVPLINHIGRRAQAMVFVFDDYHLIRSQPIHDLVGYLIENLPAQAHVFIATRADPPLPITRLRGRGQVNELRLEDLRFQEEEAEDFFNAVSGLRLAPEEVHTLQQKTEGWICGLQMTAAFLRGQEDTGAFIAGFSGSHHYIMDYLLDEVLRRESQELQAFLLETSILERLSGPLCDAVRSRGTPGSSGGTAVRSEGVPTSSGGTAVRPGESPAAGREILRELEQANLFIVSLDEQREWYRYHRLFSDLLQARLQEKEGDRLPDLHRRASVWFAEHGYIDDAVRHALLSTDAEFAADTVEGYAQEILLRGETATFLRWVQRLPEEQIQNRPKLGIYRAWALLLQGAPLSAVQTQISQSRQGHGPPGSSRSLEAFILLSQGQIEQGLRRAEEALELLPTEEVFLRDFAAMCVAGCRISMGDSDDGLQFVERTAQSVNRPASQLATVLILGELAELRLKQLRVAEAEELYQRALAISTMADGTPLPIAGQALMGLGDIALERFDLDSAQRLLSEGIELAERWNLISTLEGHFSLAMLYDAQESLRAHKGSGGVQEAPQLEETLATLDDLARRFDASEYDDIIVDMIKMRVYLREGRLDAVRQWVFGRGLEGMPAHKPAYVGDGTMASRIYKYELPILTRWHITEGRYQDALLILQELDRLAEEAERPYLLAESFILQARVHHLLEDDETALKPLQKALAIAEPQRARRLFLTEGTDIIRLLEAGRQVWEAAGTADFVDSLLSIWRDSTSPEAAGKRGKPAADAAQLAKFLSERELEVLRLLPTGLTAAQMADELFISANTLRSHLKNIYAKLGVHSRHEAVVKAVQLDLL